MGEYARRISDGQEIKIGTCEDMYYLRYEDRFSVEPIDGSEFGHRWRLPLPAEDHLKPGDYVDPYFRGDTTVPLTSYCAVGDNGEDEWCSFEPKAEIVEHPGHLQLKHPSGLLINTKCYHGLKLPEAGGDVSSIHWNGKSVHWFELCCLRSTPEGLFPVVRCRHCDHMYRESWAAVLPFVKAQDSLLYQRLLHHANCTIVRV